MTTLEIFFLAAFIVSIIFSILGALSFEDEFIGSLAAFISGSIVVFTVVGVPMYIYSNSKSPTIETWSAPVKVLGVIESDTSLVIHFLNPQGTAETQIFTDMESSSAYRHGSKLTYVGLYQSVNFGPSPASHKYVFR